MQVETERLNKSDSLIDMASLRRDVAPEIEGTQSRDSQSVIQVRKTKPKEFVRINPDESQRLIGALTIETETGKTREMFLIVGDWKIPATVEDFAKSTNLYRAMNHQGTEFLYYCRRSTNDWSVSAEVAVRRATEKWTRLRANLGNNSYNLSSPPLTLPEPRWCEFTFQEFLTMAFQGRLISSPDHKVIQLLEGRIHELES
jgi:hypothetical protein